MRFGKTLLVGVGLYAMRALLNRARAKRRPLEAPQAVFADTQPATHSLRQGDETARRQPDEKRLTVLKP
jgi:hypothetical protein